MSRGYEEGGLLARELAKGRGRNSRSRGRSIRIRGVVGACGLHWKEHRGTIKVRYLLIRVIPSPPDYPNTSPSPGYVKGHGWWSMGGWGGLLWLGEGLSCPNQDRPQAQLLERPALGKLLSIVGTDLSWWDIWIKEAESEKILTWLIGNVCFV